MSEYEKTGKLVVSAMKADVHPQTVRKYVRAARPPAEQQSKHTWRTRPEAKARETENLQTLAEHHRDLWSKVTGNKELERIFKPDADIEQTPPSIAESEFLNLVFVHFETGWSVAKAGGITTIRDMQLDVRGFFTLPVPRNVWARTKKYRNPKFVRFVEKTLRQVL